MNKSNMNYKIMLTYDREIVITAEQMQRLQEVLNNPDIMFIQIGERWVKKSTIIDIQPTNRPTKEQAAKRKRIREEIERLKSQNYKLIELVENEVRGRVGKINWLNDKDLQRYFQTKRKVVQEPKYAKIVKMIQENKEKIERLEKQLTQDNG